MINWAVGTYLDKNTCYWDLYKLLVSFSSSPEFWLILNLSQDTTPFHWTAKEQANWPRTWSSTRSWFCHRQPCPTLPTCCFLCSLLLSKENLIGLSLATPVGLMVEPSPWFGRPSPPIATVPFLLVITLWNKVYLYLSPDLFLFHESDMALTLNPG